MNTMTQDGTEAYIGLRQAPSDSLRARVAAWMERRRTVARVTRELETYTPRQLADLGLCQSDIPAVARGELTR